MTAATTSEFVFSELATDPDLAELVDLFVSEVPDRISKMVGCAKDNDWEGLRRLAHQIKGAAGSYGFGAVTPYAARLEHSLKDLQQEEIIRQQLEELLDICNRLRAGTGG